MSCAPKLPAWARLTRVFLSMAPSSAAVERIFSLCNHIGSAWGLWGRTSGSRPV
jgi:hypothetical protein